MSDLSIPDDIRDETRTAWHRYLDQLNPFRPDLYRYCRHLTANAWDAEDLVQDALIRGFGRLGTTHQTIDNPRAYLLRIATNLWIDTVRRRDTESSILAEQSDSLTPQPYDDVAPDRAPLVRDAGAALMQTLSPQEQAAVLLKDVFEMSLEESASILGTTIGAVKAALHHGRERLAALKASAKPRGPAPSTELVDRFTKGLNERDLPLLLDLMLDTGTVQTGYLSEYGRHEFERSGSWLWSACNGHPNRPKILQGFELRQERIDYRGEPIILSLQMREGCEGLVSITCIDELDGRVAGVRSYAGPEFIRELSEELDLPCHTYGLYRPPTPGPGKTWPTPTGHDLE
jgi:RNA polymerase sigma-70 factor (ECF subfamily)